MNSESLLELKKQLATDAFNGVENRYSESSLRALINLLDEKVSITAEQAARIEKLEKALRHYADPTKWE